MRLGTNKITNREILQQALDQIPSLDNLQVIGGTLLDNGFGKTLVIDQPKKKFKIKEVHEVCGSDSDSESEASDVGDAVDSKCCGYTAYYGVEVQPNGCGGWNEVCPELNKYILFEANRGEVAIGTVVEAEKGAKDEWIFFANGSSFGGGGGTDGSDYYGNYDCTRVLADLRCEDGETVKVFVHIPIPAGVQCEPPSDEPVS